MNPQKKITIQKEETEQQQVTGSQQTQRQGGGREFGSVEELLREDASHTLVPPAIANRLQESVKELPAASRRSWWRRIFPF